MDFNDHEKPTLLIPKNQSRFNSKKSVTSPTDTMLSPVTMKLLRRKEKLATNKTDFKISDQLAGRKIYPQPTEVPIILGSTSANRRQILTSYGWTFTTMSPDIDEKAIRFDDPMKLPLEIARGKALALIDRITETDTAKILITADQICLFDSFVREKPSDSNEAYSYLSSYSNNKVSTVSAIVVTHFPSMRQVAEIDVATVHWGTISDEVITRVLDRGAVYSSAGGFCIEDEDLKGLVKEIEGTIDSIQGLPMDTVVRCITEVLNEPVGYDMKSDFEEFEVENSTQTKQLSTV